MQTYQLNQLQNSFASLTNLQSLVLEGQQLKCEALDSLKEVLKQNREIRQVGLQRNQLGLGVTAKDRMSQFLEVFTVDLNQPHSLDLSSNEIDDECLYPIIKYFFASRSYKPSLTSVNLEWNAFSNKGKRTIVVAYSKCFNRKLQCKFGPLPLTQATFKQAITVQPSKHPEEDAQTIEIVVRRKPSDPTWGMKQLPLQQHQRDQVEEYRHKIEQMCALKQVVVEELQELVLDIANSEIEVPRYFLQPLFILANE